MQQTLSKFFGNAKTATAVVTAAPVECQLQGPPGLRLIENFITPAEEADLLTAINSAEQGWDNRLKRRTQHYGFLYDYTARSIDKKNYLGPLPQFTDVIVQRMLDGGYITERPIQLIVNEYTPGQGIYPHTDAKMFGDPIISLSLGSSCGFIFTSDADDAEDDQADRYEYLVRPRTLMIMSGPSRSDWRHGIPLRKTDKDEKTGATVKRGTRVSMTFRTVPGFQVPR